MPTCKYCGVNYHGGGCISPDGFHESLPDDYRVCVRCGSTSYGSGCCFNPDQKGYHRHGIDGKHCIWCGDYFPNPIGAVTGYCVLNPTGPHHQLA